MNEAIIVAVIGLIGVLVGSAITVAKEVVTSIRERKRKARYAAIRIICVLEEYAQKCVDVVSDDGTAEGRPAGRTSEGQEFHEPQVECPQPPAFPEDIDWENISERLLSRILMLPNAARGTGRDIAGLSEHSFPPDYCEAFEARQEGYANLGLEALELADELQRECDLPERTLKTLNPDWNPREYLKQKKQEIEAQKSKRALATEEMLKNLNKAIQT